MPLKIHVELSPENSPFDLFKSILSRMQILHFMNLGILFLKQHIEMNKLHFNLIYLEAILYQDI